MNKVGRRKKRMDEGRGGEVIREGRERRGKRVRGGKRLSNL